MTIVGIVMLSVFCYCVGFQKGKNPHFFKTLFKEKEHQPKKREHKSSAEKVVSIQQYKNKRSSR